MTDCSNAEIRDLLPDYVHDQLSVTDHARVKQHVVSCADCAEELVLLQTVLAVRPQVTLPNVADIVARLPKPGQFTTVTLPDNTRVAAIEGVRDIATAKSVVRKSNGFRNWRAIAAVAVFAVGAASLTMLQKGVSSGELAPLSDSATVADLQLNNGANANLRNDSALNTAKQSNIVLSVGDPSEYTDDELDAFMSSMDKWDGSASADPLPVVPILPPGS